LSLKHLEWIRFPKLEYQPNLRNVTLAAISPKTCSAREAVAFFYHELRMSECVPLSSTFWEFRMSVRLSDGIAVSQESRTRPGRWTDTTYSRVYALLLALFGSFEHTLSVIPRQRRYPGACKHSVISGIAHRRVRSRAGVSLSVEIGLDLMRAGPDLGTCPWNLKC
jgi:hypothetical protein